jgi:hypothetical protein
MSDLPPNEESAPARVPWPVAGGMFLIAMMVLLLQIALTRIMSVSVSHHSAFLVLAIVMLGLAASAIAAFQHLNRQTNPVTPAVSIRAAYRAALATCAALFLYVHVVSVNWAPWYRPLHIILAAATFYAAFYYSGYVVASLLARYARDVARLYWFDLAGAAAGCLVIVPLLNHLSALEVVVLCAGGMALSGALLSRSMGHRRDLIRGLVLTAGLLIVLGAVIGFPDLTRLRYRAGTSQSDLLWERWNSIAKVSVMPERPQAGWGTSRAFHGEVAPVYWLEIDNGAGTEIVKATAPREQLEFLRWDVTAAAYWLRPTHLDRVLIIGGGGGRDALTAVISGSRDVDVIELNPAVVEAVQERFGDFSGKLYSWPNVHMEIGEARSTLSRRDQRYDLIQMSMVDTFAASMAGSLVLTENSLYTQEAFDLYLSKLTDDGMLSVSRWYGPRQRGEVARVLGLLSDALHSQGVRDPENHVAVVYNHGYMEFSAVTCIAKRSPFTSLERSALVKLCQEKQFTLLWPEVEGVTQHEFLDVRAALGPESMRPRDPEFDTAPPTDDCPFFFNARRPILSWVEAFRTGDMSMGSDATVTLGGLLVLMVVAGYFVVVRPLQEAQASVPLAERRPLSQFRRPIAYFAGIGVGFMLVELALLQRYILFLGHPSYAMALVLFTLLLFSSLGSALSGLISDAAARSWVRWPLLAIPLLILVTAFGVPDLLLLTHPWPLGARLVLAAALIAPLALCMGMIFPLGVRLLSQDGLERYVPWMWGVNGICSMGAAVVGMCVAITLGYTAVLLLGLVAYLGPLFASLPGRGPTGGGSAPGAAPDPPM